MTPTHHIESAMRELQRNLKPVGPYCSYPRDTWDGTCTHPPGCADVVAELWREHKIRLGLEKQS